MATGMDSLQLCFAYELFASYVKDPARSYFLPGTVTHLMIHSLGVIQSKITSCFLYHKEKSPRKSNYNVLFFTKVDRIVDIYVGLEAISFSTTFWFNFFGAIFLHLLCNATFMLVAVVQLNDLLYVFGCVSQTLDLFTNTAVSNTLCVCTNNWVK